MVPFLDGLLDAQLRENPQPALRVWLAEMPLPIRLLVVGLLLIVAAAPWLALLLWALLLERA